MSNEFRAELIRFLPRLRRFARGLTGNLETGDDLVQESCLRALSRVDQFQPGMRLDSWMFKIAKNIWIDRLRAEKTRGTEISMDDSVGAGSSDGQTLVEHRLTLQAVDHALDQLPPDLRVLICLVSIDGLSYRDTADVVGVPIGTVMSRLARARRQLHDLVNNGADPVPRAVGS